jgi:hypothetical protein
MCLFELSDPDTGVTDLVLMLFQQQTLNVVG